MSTSPRGFVELPVARVSPEAAGSVAVTLTVPAERRGAFAFEPGQFLTVRALIDGQDVRRSYSISSPRSLYTRKGELTLGIRPVDGGVFSHWAATQLKAGDTLQAMPPDGRFTVHRPRALHRVGFAAGSGITPILSIMTSTLEESPTAKFTLVYGNRRMASVMFNEALQDLKDRYRDRLTLIHILSRQAQEVPLLEGRIDGDKVRALIAALLPVPSMDEVFVCGPEAMIEATEQALLGAGVKPERIHTERFTSPTLEALPRGERERVQLGRAPQAEGEVALTVVLDGKPHELRMGRDQRVLDVALEAGLDLPWSCRGGVCCTCRAKVVEGQVEMEKNFTLEPWETEQGFVLSCQARPTTDRVVVSYDER
ncbi:MAG: phenylacetic acid degradation protein [Hydrogenophaga sp. SCN 70-13]|uniref:2Fe-2S iron-sulfur cluster-binding protein n=1 Tax=unclassified Hydrogenophaga TaxID=2610897 RepID=UPI00086D2676|nr:MULTISPECIES: 2Fe-2S iron-sulfur cluster-binding protein [unclassified Hydrogenophaga]MBN9371782.1 2Fe-2S iron-sulfur cluster binding domain-containing protein [Hydrogenophaga sp.]ODT30208.1 MAG: phenylacetic acid degradation protein [Hydrogenophaga sp. SCN 70-13]OJV60766.1 MAG: phenylacetic acid degradation protein [Hydrogenophaga sp. 70-12]